MPGGGVFRVRTCIRLWCRWRHGRARIVFLCFIAVVTLVALFRLSNQDIKFGLKIFKQLLQLLIAAERLFELFLQMFELLLQEFILLSQPLIFCFQLDDVVAHYVHQMRYRQQLYTICYRCAKWR